MDLRFDYVVFGYSRDYFRIMFKDAVDEMGVEYIGNPIKHGHYNSLMQLCFNLHHNVYLNWLYPLPFKDIWFPYYYKGIKNKPICFIFLIGWCNNTYIPLFKLLKNKYPSCKLVLYLEDVVESRVDFSHEALDYFDLCMTFDEGDAERYNFNYFPTFMSKMNITPQEDKRTNVCFCGVEKGRTPIINDIYKKLSASGLICDFLVTQVSDKQALVPGIKISKRDKPYAEYLQTVVNSDIIVEIMRKNAVGYTLRTWEALLYDKKLLTNNTAIKKAPFYDPNRIFIFEDSNSIDINVITSKSIICDKKYEKEISPIRFIKYIEAQL